MKDIDSGDDHQSKLLSSIGGSITGKCTRVKLYKYSLMLWWGTNGRTKLRLSAASSLGPLEIAHIRVIPVGRCNDGLGTSLSWVRARRSCTDCWEKSISSGIRGGYKAIPSLLIPTSLPLVRTKLHNLISINLINPSSFFCSFCPSITNRIRCYYLSSMDIIWSSLKG